KGATPAGPRGGMGKGLARRPGPKVDSADLAPLAISVRVAVGLPVGNLPRLRRVTFRRLTGHLIERLEVIVHFLAVLELYKQGTVELHQVSTFGQLDIEWVGERGDTVLDPSFIDGMDTYDG